MLQPININPVPLQIADTNLGILQGAGPSSPAYNEYNPLFNRNKVSMQASGVSGQQDTYGDEVTLNALYDRYSVSLGQLYYRTDGFRNNNDLKKEIYDLFAQVSLTYQTSVQAEVKYMDGKTVISPCASIPRSRTKHCVTAHMPVPSVWGFATLSRLTPIFSPR